MILIHDRRLPEEYKKGLLKKLPGCELVPFGPPDSGMYDSISCHPDMWLFQISAGTVVHAPGIPEDIIRRFRSRGIDSAPGEDDPSGEYPGTARYNAARAGKRMFHNLEYTDPEILKKAREAGLEAVDVSQGYTGCSVLPVGDKALITADRDIAGKAVSSGLDVLVIDPGGIELPGHNHGFIGGAAGVIPGGEITFLGDISRTPDHNAIRRFLNKHAIQYICIEGLPLFDAGGLFFF